VALEFSFQNSAGLNEQALVDCLVRDTHGDVARILHAKPSRDLLRRPIEPKLLRDETAKSLVSRKLADLRASSHCRGASVGRRAVGIAYGRRFARSLETRSTALF
jgi:hypothetical protein